MKIFITGACGFVGWHLSTRLINDKKHELYLTDGFVGKQASLSLKREKRVNHPVHPIDINFPKLLSFKMAEFKPDVVIHLAALSGVREGQADAVSYIQTNVVGTSNVFEAAINAKAKHVLYASSASVYAGVDLQTWQSNIDERTFPAPTSIYGMTKFNNEVLATALNKKQSDTTFTGLRFANVCGVYGRPESILYQMAKHIVLKRPIPIHGDENLKTIKRQFTDVTFVAAIIEDLIKRKHETQNGCKYFFIHKETLPTSLFRSELKIRVNPLLP